MEELKKIIEQLKQIRTEAKLKFPDSVLFEQSVDIFLSRQIGKQQDKRAGIVDKTIKDPNSPMSEKQRAFLIKNDYRGDMNLNKAEASQIIDDFIKSNKANSEYR